ncbi:hypothetical protein V6N12_039872 [Hibiscus sabdariffa]|uniref:Uncharacterized protein n=1 Tax=Hibiscus sabdariffa TaxID=183260 RepID=A0ABR2E224_9ROSI
MTSCPTTSRADVSADAALGDYAPAQLPCLDVAVGYRGKMLGHVTSDHGHVREMGSSYVDAQLELNGVEVLSDVVYFLEDMAKGIVPFDTITEFTGSLGLSLIKFPLKIEWRWKVRLLHAYKEGDPVADELVAIALTRSYFIGLHLQKYCRFFIMI